MLCSAWCSCCLQNVNFPFRFVWSHRIMIPVLSTSGDSCAEDEIFARDADGRLSSWSMALPVALLKRQVVRLPCSLNHMKVRC